jgi:hypothetical protein
VQGGKATDAATSAQQATMMMSHLLCVRLHVVVQTMVASFSVA